MRRRKVIPKRRLQPRSKVGLQSQSQSQCQGQAGKMMSRQEDVALFARFSRSLGQWRFSSDVDKGWERHGGMCCSGRSRQGVVMRTLHMHTYLQTGGPRRNPSLLYPLLVLAVRVVCVCVRGCLDLPGKRVPISGVVLVWQRLSTEDMG